MTIPSAQPTISLYELDDRTITIGLSIQFVFATTVDEAFAIAGIVPDERPNHHVTVHRITRGTRIGVGYLDHDEARERSER